MAEHRKKVQSCKFKVQSSRPEHLTLNLKLGTWNSSNSPRLLKSARRRARGVRVEVGRHSQALERLIEACEPQARLDDAREVERRARGRSLPREVEHVAQDLRDARDLRGGEPEHLARLRLVLAAQRARLKYLDERRDGGERVVDFVRDARGERARGGKLLRADEVFVQSAQALDVVGHLAAHLVEGGGEESDLVVTSEFDACAVGPSGNVNGGLGQTPERARDDAYDERDEDEVWDERSDDAEDE